LQASPLLTILPTYHNHEHRNNQWSLAIAEILQSIFAMLDGLDTWQMSSYDHAKSRKSSSYHDRWTAPVSPYPSSFAIWRAS